jgi:glycosyltransferase involved in cell wall biosynthesis
MSALPGHHRRLKIAVMGSTYARHHDDAQVPWLRESVNRLAQLGHEMTVIVPSFKGLKSHRIDDVEVLRFRYAPRPFEKLTHDEGAPNKLRNPLYQIPAVSYIAMGTLSSAVWAARRKFDLIHVHWPFPHGLFALAAARVCGAKVVAMCHGAELALARRKGWVRSILRSCLQHSDRIACNSSHTQNEIAKLCGRDATLIPYGATTHVETTLIPIATQDQPATILFTGRHIQRKGVPYLLKALPQILARRPVKLLLTGDGDRRQEWEELTHRLGLSAHVEFLGFVSNDRLQELYRQCNVYVLPAIFDDRGDTEGLGVVLIEALQNAKPVVASSVGGIVDVIKHEETGLLVPEKDASALAAAILRLLDDRTLGARLGLAGRKHAEDYFAWDRVTAATEKLYYETLACGSRGTPAPSLKGAYV